jgi:hypothetical protein
VAYEKRLGKRDDRIKHRDAKIAALEHQLQQVRDATKGCASISQKRERDNTDEGEGESSAGSSKRAKPGTCTHAPRGYASS